MDNTIHPSITGPADHSTIDHVAWHIVVTDSTVAMHAKQTCQWKYHLTDCYIFATLGS